MKLRKLFLQAGNYCFHWRLWSGQRMQAGKTWTSWLCLAAERIDLISSPICLGIAEIFPCASVFCGEA